jgi:CRP-like cAMP-binding protein
MTEDRIVRKLRKELETALAKRREDDAADVLGKLMEADPKTPRWPHKRGDLLRKLGHNKLAIESYAVAATVYAEQGFIARAVAMAKTILNLDPSRIDVLESVDPEAARKLHRVHRPNALSARPPSPPRHAAVLEDDELPAQPAPRRHPMVLDDDGPATPPQRHPMVLDDDMPAAPPARRHPMVLDDDLPMPPPAPPRAAPRAGPAPQKPRPLTLDQLSEPPPAALPRPAAVPRLQLDGYGDPTDLNTGSALELADELVIAPDVRPNETRFSNAPPARRRPPSIDIELTDLELGKRIPALPPVPASMPPTPPSPKQLSKLPLFPLFAEVPKHALALLVQGADVIELQDGSVVMRRGELADALYGIVEGAVEVGVSSQQMRLTLSEGDVFGESALLAGEKRHADVVVKGYLVALRISRAVMNQALAAYPPLAEVLLELLTRRLLGNLLQASPLFQEFDMRGRQEIVRLFEVRRAPAGTFLAEQGKQMDGLYINLTGELEVAQRGATLAVHGTGTMFGHGAMLTHEPSTISVRTRNNMLVLRLPSTAFHALIMQYPAIFAQVSDLSGSEVARVLT